MKRIAFSLILMFCFSSSFTQDNVQWKSIVYDQFKDNSSGWLLEDNTFRQSKISDGALVHNCTAKGAITINKIEAKLDESRDYTIKFNIANLHNNPGERHEVFDKNKDGEIKSKTVGKSEWGFAWGFKDWNNYNAIVFKREPKGDVTSFEVYTKKEGKTKQHMEWRSFGSYGINNGVTANSIAIYKTDNEINIYSESGGTPTFITTIDNPTLFGDSIGPLIGSGAEVVMDFLTVRERKNHPVSDWTEESIKEHWVDNGIDNIEGIYESTSNSNNSPKYTLALKKEDDQYTLIYLNGAKEGVWKQGDVKAYLTKTGTPMLFKVEYFMADRSLEEDLYIGFEKGAMKIIWTNRNENIYIKLFPTLDDDLKINRDSKSSGTGFAIATKGYIATNYHVVSGSDKISVRGINGDFGTTYNAKIVLEDKNNDLAVIKIDDDKFEAFQNIPYTIKRGVEDVGSSVYALGYPLRATMGDEVKLTNGIISSKTGYQGDITTYQISVPIQPGNSGGPMFDEDGNIVGIVNAKHLGTDNVSYAIKTNYLYNLLEILDSMPEISKENDLQGLKLSEQVKSLKKYVFIVEIN